MIDVTDHITDRISRARIEIELRRSLRPLVIIALGGAFGLACWIFVLSNINAGVLQGHREVRFTVDDATAVVAGRHDVQISGVEVGTITKAELVDGRAVLTARIRESAGPIYRDARAELRPNTALQDMRLDIVSRGTRAAGEARSDAPLPARQTDTGASIEEVLQAFSPAVRDHMREVLAGLGTGLQDRGADLRRAFVAVVPFVDSAVKLSDQLRVRGARTRQLITDSATLTQELGRRDGELRRLSHEGADTLTTLAEGAPDLEAGITALPPTLDELDRSFRALRGVLPAVDTAVTDLRPVARALPGGLRAVRALSTDADPALDDLQGPVRQLVPLAQALEPLSTHAARAVANLRPQVPAIDHVTRSVADCTLGIYGFMQWTSSVAKFRDSRGIFPRGDAALSLNSAGGVTGDPNLKPRRGCSPGMPKKAVP
jgi:ABC-type transporter Mla subunit MlaD